jgi:gliding motility-associated-like protein
LRARKINTKSFRNGLFCVATLLLLFIYLPVTHAQSYLTLDSVSVNENNHVIIGWTLETDIDEGFIEIHRRYDDTYEPIIPTLPLTQSSYLDTSIDAGNKAYSYYVVARLPNGDSFAVSNEAHQTIFQKPPDYDICSRQIFVNWNNYAVTTSDGAPVPLPVPFDNTNVIWSFNDQEFTNHTAVGINAQYLFFPVEEEGKYCFKIRSYHSETNISSTSNAECIEVRFAPAPSFVGFRRLSYSGTNVQVHRVFLEFLVEDPVEGAGYVIQRLDPDEDKFFSLDTLFSPEKLIMFYDEDHMAHLRSETYRLHFLDSCKVFSWESPEVSTIYASVEAISNTENLVEWNLYNGWEHGVFEYLIIRKLHEMTSFGFLDRVDPFTTSYIDNLSLLDESEQFGEISYIIWAIEVPTDLSNEPERVYSNIATLERDTDVFIPNAFKPESAIPENRIFKPRFMFFTPSSYSMTIFNRWGERIFTTDDHNTGWDGRMNGREAPAGVYSYVIRYSDHSGKSHEKPGTLVLVR